MIWVNILLFISDTNLTGLVVSTATEDGIVNQCGVVQSALLPGEWMSFKCISDTRYDRLTITTLRTPSVDAFLCEVVAFGCKLSLIIKKTSFKYS